jgi:hypothetical protein
MLTKAIALVTVSLTLLLFSEMPTSIFIDPLVGP